MFLRELGRSAIGLGAAASAGCAEPRRGPAPSTEPLENAPEPAVSSLPLQPPQRIVLADRRSDFNHVVVEEQGSIRTMYFEVDGRLLVEGTIDLERPTGLDLDIFETMMASFVLQPRVQKLAMVGLGAGQVTNYLFHRFPDLQIDVAEICPVVADVARKYFHVPDDPRYRIHVGDGRLFIEQAPPDVGWDLIVLDAFRGRSVPRHLRTRQFYEACRSRLAPGGVITANVHRSSRRYEVDRATMAAVFPNSYRFTNPNGTETVIILSPEPQRVSDATMLANARSLASRFDFDVVALAGRHQPDEDFRGRATVLDDDFSAEELEAGVQRHNESCAPRCADDEDAAPPG